MSSPSRGRRGLTLSLSALVLVLSLVASACASSSSSSSSAGSSTSSSAASPTFTMPAKDPTIAAEVPSSIASTGTLTIPTDATYPPMESVNPQTQQIEGADIDLGNAIGAVMGLKVVWTNVSFDPILAGMAAQKWPISLTSMTDTKDREKVMDFVTYFVAGTSFYTKATGGPNVTGLDSLCGLTVGVERGTTQAHDSTAQSKKCTAAGNQAVNVQQFTNQNDANTALQAGRVQVVMADSPVAGYIVGLSNGQFKLSGNPYGTAPYGVAIARPKGTAAGQAPMSKPVLDAVTKLIADGTYMQILQKWGLESGAITTPQINGAVF